MTRQFKKLNKKQLLKKIKTAEWNKENHPTIKGRQGWAEVEKSAREELSTRNEQSGVSDGLE
jgi:hypothetical protein